VDRNIPDFLQHAERQFDLVVTNVRDLAFMDRYVMAPMSYQKIGQHSLKCLVFSFPLWVGHGTPPAGILQPKSACVKLLHKPAV
jgi:hypothetical protein